MSVGIFYVCPQMVVVGGKRKFVVVQFKCHKLIVALCTTASSTFDYDFIKLLPSNPGPYLFSSDINHLISIVNLSYKKIRIIIIVKSCSHNGCIKKFITTNSASGMVQTVGGLHVLLLDVLLSLGNGIRRGPRAWRIHTPLLCLPFNTTEDLGRAQKRHHPRSCSQPCIQMLLGYL